MKFASKQLQSLKQQAEAAPWLKWAALVVGLLSAGLLVQALEKARSQHESAAIDAEQNLRRVLALKGQDVWLEREKSAVTLRDSLLNQLPTAATPGLAQATLQSWLRQTTSNFDANQNIRVTVNRAGDVQEIPGVMKVNASVSGNLSPREALGFLRQIETSPNLIIVESISLQSDSSNVLQLTLNAYYRAASPPTP